jgi:outer membrane protein OmpA-like peptidoglycan-associated protein
MFFKLVHWPLSALILFACLATGCASRVAMNHDRKGDAETAPSGKQGIGPWQAVIGDLSGKSAGGAPSQYMESQAEELGKVVQTQRIGDGIIVTLSNKALFDFASADLRAESRIPLRKIAAILIKYAKTNLTIAGHTDDIGSIAYNIMLSEHRAKAVGDYLVDLGVPRQRIRIMGLGFERPLASNASAEGRARNRRVEIHIVPSEELRTGNRPRQG